MLENLAAGRLTRAVTALLVLALATWAIVQCTSPAGAGPLPEAQAALEVGGRQLLSCAFGIGMIVGGALAMSHNPLGGATAISLGWHMALYGCT